MKGKKKMREGGKETDKIVHNKNKKRRGKEKIKGMVKGKKMRYV